MKNMKVHELAKELNISNSQLINNLKNIGIEVNTHLATLTEEECKKAKKMFGKKEESKPKQTNDEPHIIRRQVKVINTNNGNKTVDEITTNISGDVQKTHHTTVDEKNKQAYSKEGLGVVTPRQANYNKPRFQNNRTNNIVVTRNGKPVEKKEQSQNIEQSSNQKDNVGKTNNQTDNRQNRDNKRYDQNRPNNNRNGYSNNNGYRNNNNYNNRNYNNNNNNNNGNNGNNYNNNSNNGYRNNNFNRNQNRNFTDNTTYQVNKFIKNAATGPVEQKDTKDYSLTLIDKKKHSKEGNVNDGKRSAINKNELREKHSRISTSKLKGMQVDTSNGLIDLYERDTDMIRKSSSRKKAQKVQKVMFEQTKIIPMTEVKLPETMTVKEFAETIKKQASEIIKKLFGLGIMATVNQEIDFDTAYLIAQDFGITAEKQVIVTEEDKLFDDSEDNEKDLVPRPPIVVVMGHVDHGKTSLLDKIRSENVVGAEAGGITQHIGAYKVEINKREICFLDTPGHEAFTQMRARGAQVTDVAIIVVAADDGIKPQTIEAIDHAKAAGVTIIVAINKIDKPTANIDKVKQELLEVGLVSEEWGGDTICVPISAKTGQGIENLLEMVLLVADMKELKSNPNKQAKGTVLEARLDKNIGTMVSMLVQRGTLNVGDTIVVGDIIGKVRAMKDDKGKKVKVAGPSTPVEIIGLSEVPQTGDIFYEVKDEKTAKQLVEKRKAEARTNLIKQGSKVTLNDLFCKIKEGQIKELNVIIKADVQGSVEALRDSLEKLSNEEVRVRVIHASTGAVKESDVTLAAVSNAIIIAFNVRPDSIAAVQSQKEKVDLRTYRVIYDAINDVETAMKGMLAPTYKEVIHGDCEVRQLFKISNVGTIAGCYVKNGKILKNTMIRIIRDSIVIAEDKLDSLKREKNDVKEVAEGYECGIKLEKYNELQEGDILECFEMQEEKRG